MKEQRNMTPEESIKESQKEIKRIKKREIELAKKIIKNEGIDSFLKHNYETEVDSSYSKLEQILKHFLSEYPCVSKKPVGIIVSDYIKHSWLIPIIYPKIKNNK
jgi:hypothetical protein